ncbi:MAG: farnesyl diphosphate synthase [Candidatus Sericytochromatia bacterium]|nr:farnesyl diphosphate synthase [Candidatus Sericytochromatia bacterium]
MPSAATFDLPTYWQGWKEAVDAELARLVATGEPARLWESMRYSLQAGGKRIRPLLCLATVEALGGQAHEVLTAACAVELIHTQSLIHDDLPAMDNDDLRRGLPTNHRVFGEAQAILAGDALLAWAFTALTAPTAGRDDPRSRLAALDELARATVAMIAGQVVDIESEGKAVGPETLSFIHRHKTGALIRAAVRIGALLGAADERQAQALDAYADALGLAFQIADDILDSTRTAEELGKTPGKDAAAGKATYVTVFGLDEARRRLDQTTEECLATLGGWGSEANPLRAIARYVGAQVQ